MPQILCHSHPHLLNKSSCFHDGSYSKQIQAQHTADQLEIWCMHHLHRAKGWELVPDRLLVLVENEMSLLWSPCPDAVDRWGNMCVVLHRKRGGSDWAVVHRSDLCVVKYTFAIKLLQMSDVPIELLGVYLWSFTEHCTCYNTCSLKKLFCVNILFMLKNLIYLLHLPRRRDTDLQGCRL